MFDDVRLSHWPENTPTPFHRYLQRCRKYCMGGWVVHGLHHSKALHWWLILSKNYWSAHWTPPCAQPCFCVGNESKYVPIEQTGLKHWVSWQLEGEKGSFRGQEEKQMPKSEVRLKVTWKYWKKTDRRHGSNHEEKKTWNLYWWLIATDNRCLFQIYLFYLFQKVEA